MMKSLYIIIICFFVLQTNFAQNKYFIGINVSPSLSFAVINHKSDFLEESLNLSFGINGLCSFNDNFFIGTGMRFIQNSFSINNIPDLRNTLIDLDNYNQISTFNSTETYQSINLPLTLYYNLFGEEKTSIILFGGIEIGYLFRVNYKYDYSNGNLETYSRNHNDLIGSFDFGAGLYQQLSGNFLLIITPKYSYALYPKRGKYDFGFHTFNLDSVLYYQLN